MVLLSAGVIATTIGVRRRRSGTEPRCRKCDYDLTGLTPLRCPECGADTSAPGAIARGRRIRAHRTLALGILALLLGAGAPAITVLLLSRGFVVHAHLPNFVLLKEAEGWLGTPSLAGLDEIQRRLRRAQLSEAEIGGLTNLALAEQSRAALRGRTSAQLFDILGTARARGHISDATWQRVLDRAVALRAPRIEQSAAGRVLVVPFEARAPSWVRVGTVVARVELDGVPTTLIGSGLIHVRGGRGERFRLRLPSESDAARSVRITLDLQLDEATDPGPLVRTYRSIRAWRQELSFDISDGRVTPPASGPALFH